MCEGKSWGRTRRKEEEGREWGGYEGFFFQAAAGMRDKLVAFVRTCALPVWLTLRHQPVCFERVVRAVVSAAAPPAWQARRVEVLADVADDLPHAHADPDRLAQAMHNLVHNAIRHTPPGGIVAVSATSENGVVRIAVRDTGAGIDEAHLPHVWERFYQADPEAGGAGLGLSIVKELVELMGGTVAAESRTGQGSCFSISLPRA